MNSSPAVPEVEMIRVAALVPYAMNARTHSDAQVAQIAASIREFGFNNPVLIDEANGIIAGHGRVLAARVLSMPAVPCIRLSHLTDVQRRAYVLADNRIALNAGWDLELLRLEMEALRDAGADLDLLGFDASELGEIAPADGLPELSPGPRTEIQQMTFLLHDDQVATVKAALLLAKQQGAFGDTGNENGTGNALARIAAHYLASLAE